jgi:hypothetical protein
MLDNDHMRSLLEQAIEEVDDSELPTQWAVDDYDKHVDSPAFVKYDDHKRRWDLLPLDSIESVIMVLEHGAEKYSDNNWTRGCAWSRYWAAAMRHLAAWWMGESVDPESGLSHLAHASCAILFLLAFEIRHAGTDDRGGS